MRHILEKLYSIFYIHTYYKSLKQCSLSCLVICSLHAGLSIRCSDFRGIRNNVNKCFIDLLFEELYEASLC